jgi:hypothetical protein
MWFAEAARPLRPVSFFDDDSLALGSVPDKGPRGRDEGARNTSRRILSFGS